MRSLLVVILFLGGCSPPPKIPLRTNASILLDHLEKRVAILDASSREIFQIYHEEVRPIEESLLKRARDPQQARIAAWALRREGAKQDLSPRLLAEILREENPWLISDTSSYAGAQGWMQVMPFHEFDGIHDCGPDLNDGPTSVCYGADIFRRYLGIEISRGIRAALLRYNGCVRTPGCEIYAERIMARLDS